MRINDYKIFFEEVIQPCIAEVGRYAETEMPGQTCLTVKKRTEKKIYSFYQKKRDFIKYNYMSKKTPVALDRHKVAACMVYAILKANPIKVNRSIPNLPEKVMLANEYLAFFVALNIIEMYKLDELGEENGTGDYHIIIPRTYHEKENEENTYESNICKAWYFIKIDDMEKFDVLAYANVFFLLQKYTDTYLKTQM